MDGLESAAASIEYSWVKYAPMRTRCSRSRRPGVLDEAGHGLVVALQGAVQVGVPIAELLPDRRQRGRDVRLGQCQDALDDLTGAVAPVRQAVRRGQERPDDHPPRVGAQAHLRASDRDHSLRR